MARPTKLTPEIRNQLLGLLQASVPLDTAASILKICRKTLDNWLDQAASAEEGDDFYELRVDIEAAQARGLIPYISAIAKSGRTNTKDAKWMLERRDPKNWERKRMPVAAQEGTTPQETAAAIFRLIAECEATVPPPVTADPGQPSPSAIAEPGPPAPPPKADPGQPDPPAKAA
jgi:hypothetical protein